MDLRPFTPMDLTGLYINWIFIGFFVNLNLYVLEENGCGYLHKLFTTPPMSDRDQHIVYEPVLTYKYK